MMQFVHALVGCVFGWGTGDGVGSQCLSGLGHGVCARLGGLYVWLGTWGRALEFKPCLAWDMSLYAPWCAVQGHLQHSGQACQHAACLWPLCRVPMCAACCERHACHKPLVAAQPSQDRPGIAVHAEQVPVHGSGLLQLSLLSQAASEQLPSMLSRQQLRVQVVFSS